MAHEGWPRWMKRNFREADSVLLVCTETYLKRVETREAPGTGLGVLREAKLIYNALCETGAVSGKFIPVGAAGGRLVRRYRCPAGSGAG